MDNPQRQRLFESQKRSYTEGVFENINNQWVFFDKELDEAYPIEEYMDYEISLYRNNRWRKCTLQDEGKLRCGQDILFLHDEDKVRIRKHLLYSFERLLEDLNDDAFFQFITTLNSLEFSIYDCIYGYNQLAFTSASANHSGTNFFVFDNGEQICSVHHHFFQREKEHNRFEFTLNTGKRVIIEKLLS